MIIFHSQLSSCMGTGDKFKDHFFILYIPAVFDVKTIMINRYDLYLHSTQVDLMFHLENLTANA